MKAPSPPPTPDPYKTAAAQQMANVEVALANTWLQNADEDRPDGTVRYEQTGETIQTYTYDGNGNVTGSRELPKFKRTVQLAPKAQIAFDTQQDIVVGINRWALAQVGLISDIQDDPFDATDLTPRLPAPDAPNIEVRDAERGPIQMSIGAGAAAHFEATRQAIEQRLVEQIEIDRQLAMTRLAQQGLSPGMVAWDREMDALNRAINDARAQAHLAAGQEQSRLVQTDGMIGDFANRAQEQDYRQNVAQIELRNAQRMQQYQGLVAAAEYINSIREREVQEGIALRSNAINEISALMHGGRVPVPQFQQFRAGVIGKTPVAESVYQSAALDMKKWQLQVAQQQQMLGGILGFAGNIMGGFLAMPGFSDRRLKADVVPAFVDGCGLRWYSWRYLWDRPGTHRIGVMAQELLGLRPGCVVRIGPWLAVDYGRLKWT